jgi:tRNA dimethylallyltransferase
MQKIERNDKYRIEKAYAIYKQSGLCPTSYFEKILKFPLRKI